MRADIVRPPGMGGRGLSISPPSTISHPGVFRNPKAETKSQSAKTGSRQKFFAFQENRKMQEVADSEMWIKAVQGKG